MATGMNHRLSDPEGMDKVLAHNPLHGFFRGIGPPLSLTESFVPIYELCQMGVAAELELFPDTLEVVKRVALDFAGNVLTHADRNNMSVEVRTSVDSLSIEEAAAVCVYSMENGTYKGLNKLLREENRGLLRPFVNYIWLLMHGLSKCPRPKATLVYSSA